MDPLKSGTVPIIFVKKYRCCFGSIGTTARVFLLITKIMGTVPLFNGSVPYLTCHANGPLVCTKVLTKRLNLNLLNIVWKIFLLGAQFSVSRYDVYNKE